MKTIPQQIRSERNDTAGTEPNHSELSSVPTGFISLEWRKKRRKGSDS